MDKNFQKCDNINELHAFTSIIIVVTAMQSLNLLVHTHRPQSSGLFFTRKEIPEAI